MIFRSSGGAPVSAQRSVVAAACPWSRRATSAWQQTRHHPGYACCKPWRAGCVPAMAPRAPPRGRRKQRTSAQCCRSGTRHQDRAAQPRRAKLRRAESHQDGRVVPGGPATTPAPRTALCRTASHREMSGHFTHISCNVEVSNPRSNLKEKGQNHKHYIYIYIYC